MLLAVICLCKWRGASCNRWASEGVEWVLPCCSRLLCNCISKAKTENSVGLCVTVNFPPPFPCSWFEGLNPCSEGDNTRVLCKAQYLPRVLTGAWILAVRNINTSFFFQKYRHREDTCPGTRVPAFGGRNCREGCTPKKWWWFSALFSCRTRACHLLLSQHSGSWTD